jgi:hypothetical protein
VSFQHGELHGWIRCRHCELNNLLSRMIHAFSGSVPKTPMGHAFGQSTIRTLTVGEALLIRNEQSLTRCY